MLLIFNSSLTLHKTALELDNTLLGPSVSWNVELISSVHSRDDFQIKFVTARSLDECLVSYVTSDTESHCVHTGCVITSWTQFDWIVHKNSVYSVSYIANATLIFNPTQLCSQGDDAPSSVQIYWPISWYPHRDGRWSGPDRSGGLKTWTGPVVSKHGPVPILQPCTTGPRDKFQKDRSKTDL